MANWAHMKGYYKTCKKIKKSSQFQFLDFFFYNFFLWVVQGRLKDDIVLVLKLMVERPN